MQVELREKNSSKKYYTGSVWPTNNCGEVTVIGQVNKKDTQSENSYFLVRFQDGYEKIVFAASIGRGRINNPMIPSCCGKGFFGEGIYASQEEGFILPEYRLWVRIVHRCYGEKSSKGFYVSERWLNYQNFCDDITLLEGYVYWKENNSSMAFKIRKASPKIKVYSKDTCIFVAKRKAVTKRTGRLTGLTYKAIRLDGGYEELFHNQSEFAGKHNLVRVSINHCLKDRAKTHRGWRFEIVSKN